ncbi:hypothetical protein CRG98_016761 [Punica granatum]|uniref:Uncharacterized protein n=1 Tax=Punica granatum TaxID=22663 RepID=A0A2I0K3U6_PUNGR|nr:hypothetical protein CRG98_016761 [Punica granatum]
MGGRGDRIWGITAEEGGKNGSDSAEEGRALFSLSGTVLSVLVSTSVDVGLMGLDHRQHWPRTNTRPG